MNPRFATFALAFGPLFLACTSTPEEAAPDLEPTEEDVGSSQDALSVNDLSYEQIVYHAYQVLLNRTPDSPGFDVNLAALRSSGNRAALFAGMIGSPEFSGNGALSNKTAYVTRLYNVVLERAPDAAGLANWVATLRNADGSGSGLTWYDAFVGFVQSPEYSSKKRPIAGVHFAIPINPSVQTSHADFVGHAYATVLGRTYDVAGFKTYFVALQSGVWSQQGVFEILLGSPEFNGNPSLQDKALFVRRTYQRLLKRTPSTSEEASWVAQIKAANGSGSGYTWYEFHQLVAGSAEYKSTNCQSSYYTYGRALPREAPLLKDVMSGTAKIKPLAGSDVVTLSFAAGTVSAVWDQKVAFVLDPASNRNYAFTRGYLSDGTFNIFLMRETTAGSATLSQIGGAVFDKAAGTNYYDPQIAVDNSVCPPRYVMSMECDGSLCLSYSTTPTKHETWTAPKPAMSACDPGSCGAYRSASTGMALVDHATPYISWTEVNDGVTWFENAQHQLLSDDGNERTTTRATSIGSLYSFSPMTVGQSAAPTILPATANVACADGWDCNNRDAQDWKREGVYYYAIYNGGNYFRCVRPAGSGLTSQWGLSLSRSRTATGVYDERLAQSAVVFAARNDTCGISYPTVQAVKKGSAAVSLHMYYAHYDLAGGNTTRRSEIVWGP